MYPEPVTIGQARKVRPVPYDSLRRLITPPDSPRDPRRARMARGATFPHDGAPAVEHDPDAAGDPNGVIAGNVVDMLIDEAHTLGQHFESLVAALRAITPRDTLDEDAVLTQNGAYTVQKRGRRHMKLWADVAGNIALGGRVQVASFAVVVGWNLLDLPEGTTLGLTGAGQSHVVVRYYDDPN